jgi:hypothetical protein
VVVVVVVQFGFVSGQASCQNDVEVEVVVVVIGAWTILAHAETFGARPYVFAT